MQCTEVLPGWIRKHKELLFCHFILGGSPEKNAKEVFLLLELLPPRSTLVFMVESMSLSNIYVCATFASSFNPDLNPKRVTFPFIWQSFQSKAVIEVATWQDLF